MPFGGENLGKIEMPAQEPFDRELVKKADSDKETGDPMVLPEQSAKMEAIRQGVETKIDSQIENIEDPKKKFFSRDNPWLKRIGAAAAGLALSAVDKANAGDVYRTEGTDHLKYGKEKVRNFNDPRYRYDENTKWKYKSGKPETFQIIMKDDKGREQVYFVPKGLGDQLKTDDHAKKESLSKISPEPKPNNVAEETWHPAGKSPIANVNRMDVPSKQSKIENSKPNTKPEIPGIEKKYESREKEICDKIKTSYEDLLLSDIWPKNVINMATSISQQWTESRIKNQAVSPDGAVGTMQLHWAIADVPGFLASLNGAGIKLGNGKVFKYDGPAIPKGIELPRMVDKIKSLIRGDSDYSRAFGNLHMFNLYKKGIGKKYFDKGDIRTGLKHLLAAYNMGEGNYAKNAEEKWPLESKDYVERFFVFYDDFNEIVKRIDDSGIKIGTFEKNAFAAKLGEVLYPSHSKNPEQEGKRKQSISQKIDKYIQIFLSEYRKNPQMSEKEIGDLFARK